MKNDTPRTEAARMTERSGCIATFQGAEVVPADFARMLDRENANLRDALADMVAVAEAHGWDNAEIHNAREALAGVTPKPPQ
jgi:hypothetical protein